MCDGGIMDKSAALSDIHNLAAIHGFIGYGKDRYPDETLLSTINCKLEYYLLLEVYKAAPDHHWQVDEAIDTGHDFGAEFDDLVAATFKHGSPKQCRQAVKAICDLFCQDKSTAHILDDLPWLGSLS